jgi:hypothetical protein
MTDDDPVTIPAGTGIGLQDTGRHAAARLARTPRAAPCDPGTGPAAGWVIWPGPARGYIALGNDLPPVADALEALWRMRETVILLAAYGLIPQASGSPRSSRLSRTPSARWRPTGCRCDGGRGGVRE